MKNKIQIQLSFLFGIIVAADLTGIAAGISLVHFIAKSLLIPILIVLLFVSKNTVANKNLLLTGLVFSWFGDLLLLFENKHGLFFIFGLASFLTTHVLYIIYFLKIRSTHSSLLVKRPLLLLIIVGYGISLVWFLYPHLGDLKIPVIVYAIVICIMLLCSLHIYLKVNSNANWCYIQGAVFFVLSDSLLAINKFYQPFAYAGVLIMLTYCAAQYFIVNGYIKQLPYD